MTEDTPRSYSDADVNRIIKRALKIKSTESISHEELLETASELGIDPGKIEEAVRLETSAMEQEKAKESYLKRTQSSFKAALTGFIILNGFLFLIDCMSGGGWWFQWPLLGTGLPLAFRLRDAYFPSEYQVQRALRRRKKFKRYKNRHKRSCHKGTLESIS